MYGRTVAHEDDDFIYGVDLFNAGYWWEAHVYWERLWTKSSMSEEREFLRGLIQLSAALVKQRQGSSAGRDKLLDKALERLRRAPDAVFMGVHLPELIEAIERGEEVEIELRA